MKSSLFSRHFLTAAFLLLVPSNSVWAGDKPGGALEYDPTTGGHGPLETFRFASNIVGQATSSLGTDRFHHAQFDHVYFGANEKTGVCSVSGTIPLSQGYSARAGRLRTHQKPFIIYGGKDSLAYEVKRYDIRFEKISDHQTRYYFKTIQLVFAENGGTTNFNIHCEQVLPNTLQPSEGLETVRNFFLSSVE